jgi:TetR/AcrR family transcriptional regulator
MNANSTIESVRMPTRSEQKEHRRNLILMTALDLFIQKGFASTKVSDIAGAAGMSVGLMFHYFESKEQLYEELINRGIEKPKSVLAPSEGAPLEFFTNAAESILDRTRHDSAIAKMFVLMSQASNNDFLSEETRNHLKRDNIQKSADIIRAGQQAGQIREGDPVALSAAFWGSIQGICQAMALDPSLPLPKSEWIVDILRNKQANGEHG